MALIGSATGLDILARSTVQCESASNIDVRGKPECWQHRGEVYCMEATRLQQLGVIRQEWIAQQMHVRTEEYPCR